MVTYSLMLQFFSYVFLKRARYIDDQKNIFIKICTVHTIWYCFVFFSLLYLSIRFKISLVAEKSIYLIILLIVIRIENVSVSFYYFFTIYIHIRRNTVRSHRSIRNVIYSRLFNQKLIFYEEKNTGIFSNCIIVSSRRKRKEKVISNNEKYYIYM